MEYEVGQVLTLVSMEHFHSNVYTRILCTKYPMEGTEFVVTAVEDNGCYVKLLLNGRTIEPFGSPSIGIWMCNENMDCFTRKTDAVFKSARVVYSGLYHKLRRCKDTGMTPEEVTAMCDDLYQVLL